MMALPLRWVQKPKMEKVKVKDSFSSLVFLKCCVCSCWVVKQTCNYVGMQGFFHLQVVCWCEGGIRCISQLLPSHCIVFFFFSDSWSCNICLKRKTTK